MKNTTITTIFAAILFCLVGVTAIAAQSTDSKKIEVSGGYSYTHARQLIESPNAANGWTAGAAYRATKKLSIYAEGDQDYGKFTTSPGYDYTGARTSILGGVRFHFVNGSRVTPFVNAGAGYTQFKNTLHHNGATIKIPLLKNLLFAGGGGVDVALNKKGSISWRTGIEYRRVESGEDANSARVNGSAFRVNTGIVFSF